jgi:N-acetylglucosaminyldiphosphoundecaprenol N-acetyl-beta-D-mannosaminyltransferase
MNIMQKIRLFQHYHEPIRPASATMSAIECRNLWQITQQLFAGAALLSLSPIFLVMWALTKLSSKGPFLYIQERRGIYGATFEIYKVRTMRPGCEKDTALGVSDGAAVVTPVGRVLRALKLDELPQLWNVMRGDMALVGPRPIPTALDRELRAKIPGFEMRYSVRPGLTSIGQICVQDNALRDALVLDWTLRFEGELHYLRHRSVTYDLLMIFMTGLFVVKKLLLSCNKGDPTELTKDNGRILGVPVVVGNYKTVVDQIMSWAATREHRMVGVCNVHSVVTSGWDDSLRESLLAADLNTADGMPLVWLQRLLGGQKASRVYGPTLMLKTLREAEKKGVRVAFYGGHADRLPVLIERLKAGFPKLYIVEAISPPFRELTEEEDAQYTKRLQNSKAGLIWVGLGCPKQERWMFTHRPKIPGVMVGVGAAFDFHAGFVRQAPSWLQGIGLEWAYRLAMEPRRLLRRYLTTNPIFVLRAGIQVIRQFTARPFAS